MFGAETGSGNSFCRRHRDVSGPAEIPVAFGPLRYYDGSFESRSKYSKYKYQTFVSRLRASLLHITYIITILQYYNITLLHVGGKLQTEGQDRSRLAVNVQWVE